MRRAVIYLRGSTLDQTTANQERELRETADRMGYDISGTRASVRPWRLLEGRVYGPSPNGLESIPERCSGSAALSTASASSSPSHSALKMKHMIPFRTFMSIEVGAGGPA